jgi:beta-N-acetylhexosaminidase
LAWQMFRCFIPMFDTRKIVVLLLALCGYVLAYAQNPNFRNWKNDPACIKWVDSVYNVLTPEERIGQFFMLPAYTQGDTYNMDSVLSQMARGKAGGVIFFKGNPYAQADWTNKIQSVSKVKSFVAIDGEWGLGMRIDSSISFPRQMALGAVQDNTLIYEMGREVGRECKRIGININFAPDIDVNNNANNPVINDRSFGEDKFKVALKGIEYMQGMQDEGVLACAKHFPGHGDVNKDSHKELPQIIKSYRRLDSLELYPFKILFNSGVGSVMVAHLNVPALDTTPNISSSLSRRITTDLLKDTMKFDGLVFSDALNMKGVSANYKPGTVDSLAFMAGNDILVFSENAEMGIMKIKMAADSGAISPAELEARVKKVLAYKYKLGLNKPQWVVTENLYQDITNTKGQLLRQKLYEAAVTIPVNQNNLLPFKTWDYKKVASLSIGSKGYSVFQKHIYQFAEMDEYNQFGIDDKKGFNSLIDTLASYDMVVIDMHSMSRYPQRNYGISEATRTFVEALSGRTKVVLVLFGNAYSIQYFKYLPWIMLGYEDNETTNLACANALFGAEKVSGKLPVTVADSLWSGTGYTSSSVYRLKISSPEECGFESMDLREIDDIVLKGIISHAYPGAQVIIAKDGKVLWNKGYGNHIYEEQNKIQTSDIYDLASISKVAATTIAVMKLYDEQRLDLDKTVGDYIPMPDSFNIKKLLIRDILAHQAGLKPFIPFYKNVTGANWGTYFCTVADTTFGIQVADSIYMRTSYKDSMWLQMATGELSTKGKQYVYSDIDFYILQKIVEQITGVSLDNYVGNVFYKPMGLTRIGYLPRNRFSYTRIMPTEYDTIMRKQLITGYVHDPGAAMYGGVAGHAGVFSNAFDLAALFQMLLNKGEYNGIQFISPGTVNLFISRLSTLSRRGLGFDKPEPDVTKASPCYDGVPLTTFGHTGFTGTCVWSDPTNNLTYIFLSNRVYPDAENNRLAKMNVRTDIQKVVYKALKKK